MNEIQKSNAKIAIEYYQKLLSGERFAAPFYEDTQGRQIGDTNPDFLNGDIRYFWPKKMVGHKGGRYPKPVEAREVVNGKQYFVADPLDLNFHDYITGKRSCDGFARKIERGIIHETKEAAIQHAKVMLGVSDEA